MTAMTGMNAVVLGAERRGLESDRWITPSKDDSGMREKKQEGGASIRWIGQNPAHADRKSTYLRCVRHPGRLAHQYCPRNPGSAGAARDPDRLGRVCRRLARP